MKDNHLKKLLEDCDYAYFCDDFKRLIRLCDEILKIDPDCPNAIGYKSVAYCFLNMPEKTVEILTEAIERFPENYYMKNNIAMAYYDLGQYEKSLKYCEEGLKIKNFDWLEENKIKALIKLERTDEAIEVWKNSKN